MGGELLKSAFQLEFQAVSRLESVTRLPARWERRGGHRAGEWRQVCRRWRLKELETTAWIDCILEQLPRVDKIKRMSITNLVVSEEANTLQLVERGEVNCVDVVPTINITNG